MRKIITAILILVATNSFAQRSIKELSFDDCQNSDFFREIRNNTGVYKYTASDGSILQLGDTLKIGVPHGEVTQESGSGRSTTKSSFTTITLGKPAGAGNMLNLMAGIEPDNAGSEMQGQVVVISAMTTYHNGSKKKPLVVMVLLGEPNGRAFGINKYMTAMDYENSILLGEIKSMNAPLTRPEAIAKLKESKDLLDLGVIEKLEYEKLKKDLTPIILNK